MASQGYTSPKSGRPKLVTAGHRMCLYVEEGELRLLKSKLALEGLTVSEWVRIQIALKARS